MHLKNLNHKNLKFLAIAFVGSLAATLIFELVFCNFILHHSLYFSGTRFCAVLIMVFALVNLIKFHTYFYHHLEKAFLLIALSMGFVFIMIFPKTILVSQDDAIHLARAYSYLEQGDMHWPEAFRSTAYLPVSVDGLSVAETDDKYNALNSQRDYTTHQKPTFVELSTSGITSRLIYLPYYIGFKISELFHFNFTTAFAFAKLCNCICYVIFFYFAIRVSKSLKKIFFAAGLITANLFYASQFSYDPMITASIALAIALFCRILEDRQVCPLYALGFVLATLWGSLPKATYCPLLLLGLLIPKAYFDHPRRARAYKISVMAIMLLLVSTLILPAIFGDVPGDFRGGDTSVVGQISAILNNPLHACVAFGTFITMHLPDMLLSHTVTTSGYHIYQYTKFILPLANIATMVFLAFVVLKTNKPAQAYSRAVRRSFIAVYAIITCAIIGALYLSFTAVGANSVSGVQPRYFLPILPLLLIFLTPTAPAPIFKPHKAHELILLVAPFLILASIASCYLLRAAIF